MVKILPVPAYEMNQAAEAIDRLAGVADTLLRLTESVDDATVADAMRTEIGRLLNSIDTLNALVRSSTYLRATTSTLWPMAALAVGLYFGWRGRGVTQPRQP
jgi:hypothetical protein